MPIGKNTQLFIWTCPRQARGFILDSPANAFPGGGDIVKAAGLASLAGGFAVLAAQTPGAPAHALKSLENRRIAVAQSSWIFITVTLLLLLLLMKS